MLKKIETLFNPSKNHRRGTSLLSSSTASSGNSGKSSGLIKSKDFKPVMLIEQPPLEMLKTDLNLTKHNSRYLSCLQPPNKNPRLCSNLAFDSYQGLLAYSSNPG